jgi:Fic family protein
LSAAKYLHEKDTWHEGSYKRSPNHIVSLDAYAKRLGYVFQTATPFETPLPKADLLSRANEAYQARKIHPLLITGIFIFELPAIQPFQDGNGRLSRAITTYLLLKCGYAYVSYS